MLPLSSGCHSAAMSGKHMARLLVTETFLFAQNGHPLPLRARLLIVACHLWSGPPSQSHHTFLFEPAVSSRGVRSPLRSWSHWRHSLRWVVARERFITTTPRRTCTEGNLDA